MFGIQKFTLKAIAIILGIIVGGIVIICVCNGCVPEKAALTQKEINKSSDDSIHFAAQGVGVTNPAEIILARAEGKKVIIRAEKESSRIIAYSVGIPLAVGLIAGIVLAIFYFRAYLAQSPWDKERKAVD